MTTTRAVLLRTAVVAVLLVLLVRKVGTEPFLHALGSIDLPAVLLALALTGVATLCCAWRWRVVARAVGMDLPRGRSVTAYYRSQFLNSTLPGGVLGDVHRAVDHGRRDGRLGVGARAVALERTAGQVVQVVLTVVVLLLLPSRMRSLLPVLLVTVAVAGLAVALLLRAGRPAPAVRRRAAAVRTVARELRLVGRPDVVPVLVLTSALAVAAHLATFVVAARAAGSDAPLGRLVPVAAVVLLAAAVPLNLGGWGPREGAAAWAFAWAGFGAADGVATAVVYGVLAFLATAPGFVVVVADGVGRRRSGTVPPTPDPELEVARA